MNPALDYNSETMIVSDRSARHFRPIRSWSNGPDATLGATPSGEICDKSEALISYKG